MHQSGRARKRSAELRESPRRLRKKCEKCGTVHRTYLCIQLRAANNLSRESLQSSCRSPCSLSYKEIVAQRYCHYSGSRHARYLSCLRGKGAGRAFQIKVPLTLVFDVPTVAKMVVTTSPRSPKRSKIDETVLKH
jgi:hypothetical protein